MTTLSQADNSHVLHCNMWSAQSSRFSIAICVSSKLSKHVSQHVFQNVSFLYIIVFHQFWFIKLNRFQYYLNCDCTFNLFYSIEIYICKVSLFLLQCIKIYSSETLLFNTLSETLFIICIVVFIISWSQKFFHYLYCIVC